MSSRNSYLPTTEEKVIGFSENFIGKLPKYQEKYKLDVDLVSDTISSGTAYIATYRGIGQLEQFIQSLVASKNYYKDGGPNSPALQPFALPALPNIAATAKPGFLARVRSVVTIVKANINVTDADLMDMGIFTSTADTPTNEGTTCVVTLRKAAGGQPELMWKKGDFESLEIQKMDTAGIWARLDIDLHPNYIDMTALPAAGQTAVWTYRAIYHLKGKQIGQWSNAVSITVG